MLTAERLRELIAYDEETGVFRWLPRPGVNGAHCRRNREAGSISKGTGYRTIRVDKKLYQAHRLAWLYVHGCWPAQDIDHRNGVRLDNRIANLRDVQNAINRQNVRRARADSETGVMGVTLDKRRGRYFSRVRTDGVSRYLGDFGEDAQAAHEAYLQAKRADHAGCTI